MTEHDKQVEHQSKLIKMEDWRKNIKMILNERKDTESPWRMHITYNDDSQQIEWSNSNHKEIIPSPHTEEELISMMESDEHEQQRNLFNEKRRENNGI